MAAVSFEAYLEPTQGVGYRDTAVSGVTTQYLSKDFVLSSFCALVEVTVKAGTDLTASDVRTPCCLVAVTPAVMSHAC